MMFLSKNWYFSVQKALIYYTFNKSHHNSFILLVFSHVANFRYVANFRFLTLHVVPSVADTIEPLVSHFAHKTHPILDCNFVGVDIWCICSRDGSIPNKRRVPVNGHCVS